VLLFLKLYDGYPEPVALTLRWSIYGYFWQKHEEGRELATRIVAAASMKMMGQVYDNQVMAMRTNHWQEGPIANYLQQQQDQQDQPWSVWTIGRVGSYSGHHCSWCYRPEGIRLKLTSAQKDDQPRWGDYAQKLDLKYISQLIATGTWFDAKERFVLTSCSSDRQFAPAYVLNNPQRFAYLIHHNSTLPH